MGVPAFYRWLSEKYPKIVQDVLEERVKLVHSGGTTRMPFDSTKPNPSGLEADHLYIDMNGIIHPCSHPENGPQPQSEAEMFQNVCHYVDRLFRTVRPRKLLFLAIDGVAPRAKMNQQRSRRFRSAQEARENAELEEHIRNELQEMGQNVPPPKKAWDSNVITPGTQFMLNLSEAIRFYIRKRIATDKAWQSIRVIFSDASVPGEGEHKIMSHIRLQRSQPGYSPNLVHVLHGLDADLIMLALATHEAHFYILREVVTFGYKSIEAMEKRQLESGFTDAQRQLDEDAGADAMELLENKQKPLQRVSIPILREYLAAEFAPCFDPKVIPFPVSFERLLDDIVFLCFFVGNDFLPHLPSLDIRDGALDFLFNVYKRLLPTLGDYITNHGGKVNLSHVDVILAEVGAIEDYVFQMKHENEENDKARRQRLKERNQRNTGRRGEGPPTVTAAQSPKNPKLLGKAARILERQKQAEAKGKQGKLTVALKRSTKEPIKEREAEENANAALELKNKLMGKSGEDGNNTANAKAEEDEEREFGEPHGEKRKIEVVEIEDEEAKIEVVEIEDDDVPVKTGEEDGQDDEDTEDIEETSQEDFDLEIEEPKLPEEVDPAVAAAFKKKVEESHKKKLDEFSKNVEDNVRLHEAGWKDRYYKDKCKADDVSAHGGREHLFRSYVMGLCWVMKYYYDGCTSWKWYYPFHYAPFASDLKNIERFRDDCNSFELAEPFKPVEQLLGVLPEDSAHAVPKAARWLMSDAESPVIDFYPKDVPVDPNGKAMPWLWVVLLPFIDEERLLSALKPTMSKWTKPELLCNARGMDDGYLYIHSAHPLMKRLADVVKAGKAAANKKLRLTDTSACGCASFTGAVRPPLSNEIYPIDEEVSIDPPSFASTITTGSDNLLTDPIDVNTAVCVSFSEPAKLPHKSVMLPGTTPPPSVLTNEDKRIRRPRLNRGKGTIANMGVSSGKSFQSGYGSMNISSQERDLANRMGRGNEMYQAGTRAWGAMEPTPKRGRRQGQYQQAPPYQSNPFNQRQQPQGGRNHPNQRNQPPWQAQGGQGAQRGPQSYNQGYPPGQTNQYQQRPQQQYNQQPGNRQQYAPQQQQQGYRGAGGYQQRPPPPPPPRGRPHSFQGYNRSAPPPGHRQQYQQQGHSFNRQGQPNQPPPPRANASVMNSLRSQLANTLQRNRNKDGR